MISSRLRRRDSLLFVYSTLRPFVDIPMARWLRRVARYVGSAKKRAAGSTISAHSPRVQ